MKHHCSKIGRRGVVWSQILVEGTLLVYRAILSSFPLKNSFVTTIDMIMFLLPLGAGDPNLMATNSSTKDLQLSELYFAISPFNQTIYPACCFVKLGVFLYPFHQQGSVLSHPLMGPYLWKLCEGRVWPERIVSWGLYFLSDSVRFMFLKEPREVWSLNIMTSALQLLDPIHIIEEYWTFTCVRKQKIVCHMISIIGRI